MFVEVTMEERQSGLVDKTWEKYECVLLFSGSSWAKNVTDAKK